MTNTHKFLKGQTEALAVVVLLGTTIAAAGGYYTVTQTVLDESTEDAPTIDTSAINVETCWETNNDNEVRAEARNTGEETINTSELTLTIDNKPIDNPEYTQDTVRSQNTFQIVINQDQFNELSLISGSNEETTTCPQIHTDPPTDIITQPINGIHEGGDTTQTLQWGTTGDTSIILPDPQDALNPDTFCIGDQCTQSTGNQPVETTHGEYLNRDEGWMNGTLEVEQTINTGSDGELCIGSNCPTEDGNPELETCFYGTPGEEQQDCPVNDESYEMDGPLQFDGEAGDDRGLILQSGTCIGTDC